MINKLYLHCLEWGVVFMLTLAASLPAEAGETWSISLIEQATQKHLASDPGWLALLHYKRGMWSGLFSRAMASQVDDPAFFLAQDGAHDAEAELRADLRAFFAPQDEDEKDLHAQCLFPARWHWLKQRLAIDDSHDVPCYRLQAFLQDFGDDGLSLIFPVMYLNNPGSAFGHTFLRFDDASRSPLLAQTLNYAAKVDHGDALPVYIARGVLGGYRGIFRTRPYFRTLEEYTNGENRDIWEYRLAFTREEIRQLARHVWEVKGMDFAYYFFRENCAYRLLALLDAVRPSLRLTSGTDFLFYAIPVDTVRALDARGLIVERHYRPSLASQLQDFFQHHKGQAQAVLQLAGGDMDALDAQGLTPVEKQAVLTAAWRLLQFRGESDLPRAGAILDALAQAPSGAPESDGGAARAPVPLLSVAEPAPPERGHASRRLAPGAGRENGASWLGLRFRPALHDLIDAPAGYVRGADLNVFDIEARYFAAEQRFSLQRLRLFNITSISPVRAWNRPLSWLVDTGFEQNRPERGRRVQSFVLRGGAGGSLSLDLSALKLTPHALLTGEWDIASGYDKGHVLYAGLLGGLLLQSAWGQGEVSAERQASLAGAALDKWQWKAAWQFDLRRNLGLRLFWRQRRYPAFTDSEAGVRLQVYF